MAYEQTRDILERAQKFHREVAEYYRQQGEKTGVERIRMLLDYLSRHEEHLATSLGEYETFASQKVLNTWFKSNHEMSPCDCLESFEITPETSVEDVIELGLKLDDCLIAVYEDLAANAKSEEVRSVFQNLLELERKEKRQLVRNSIRVMDF